MSELRSLFESARYLSRDESEAIAKRALGFVTAASAARINIGSGSRGNTRFAVNQVSTGGDNYDTSVTVTAYVGNRSATSTTNALDDAGLRHAVETAERLAKLAPPDPEFLPELTPQQYQPGRNWSEATAALDPQGRAESVRAITAPAKQSGLVSTGYLDTRAGSTAVANTNGLFAYARSTGAALTTTVRTPDGSGSGWAGASHHDWSRIDAASLGARAAEKARASKNPSAIEPGRYTVVFEPTAAANLVQFLAFAFNARAADEGRSFMSKPGGGNKIGTKIVDERVTIESDPFDPDVAGTPFTGEGLPTQKSVFIENGVVKTLLYDRYWAQKTGVAPTANGGSFRMSGGSSSVEEMIASTQRGLLVTRFWYLRPVDQRTILFTGLTRDGTFLIENGKVTKAVKNLRFNDSPIFMLNNLEALGTPVRVSASEDGGPGQAVVVPPMKVRDFNFTSLSDAV
ncbi:MAG: TldD/PmbA family protein [Gemmatimonadota bacterium]